MEPVQQSNGREIDEFSEISCRTSMVKMTTVEERLRALERYIFNKDAKPNWASKKLRATIHSTHIDDESTFKNRLQRFFGIGYYGSENDPEIILHATPPTAGDCYAFHGHAARIVIELVVKIHVQSLTVEHIAEHMSPIGHVKAAPKEFSIYGLIEPNDRLERGFLFGKFLYSPSTGAIQTFPVKNRSNYAYKYLLFRVHKNHGGTNTCVYRWVVFHVTSQLIFKSNFKCSRLRVHGQMAGDEG
jgi:SUN domain-containing protein 1/2